MPEPVKTSKPDGRAARWEPHRARRRAEFVDAALRAVEAYGPEVRTEQIAAEAGVPRPRLYRYFDGKADLERAVVERAAEMCVAELATLWRPEGSPRSVIDAVVSAWLRWVTGHANLYRYARTAELPGRHGPYAETKTVVSGRVSAILRAYSAALGLDPRLADPLTSGIFGLVQTTTNRWLDAPSDLTRDEFAGWLTRWVTSLLTATAAAQGVEIDLDRPLPPLTS